MDRPRYRIFISSPADVRAERLLAERVIKKLAREFSYSCDIEALLWEREPLTAAHNFQDPRNISPPRTTDVCVVIVWSRLGVPLPAAEYRGAISKRAVTGTEWEFEDALAGYQERGVPDLLLYQKTAKPIGELSDRAEVEERLRQNELVADFLSRWFKSADGFSFTAARHTFKITAEFEELLEEHLRRRLRQRLERDLGLDARIGTITWTEAPWRGLESFEPTESAIFFGRNRASNELRDMLAAQIAAGKAFCVVMGASGSGKSSLVKAGLLPDLLLPGMVGRVALVRYGVMRPSGADGDVIRALSEAILAQNALPELAGLEYTAEALTQQLRNTPRQIAFAVKQGLSAAAKDQLTVLGEARLLVIVDQLEELFTVERITRAERESFVAALYALATSGLVWVVTTMRSDFFEQFENLPSLVALSEGGRYLLVPPNQSELRQIIVGPARAAGLRFEIDPSSAEALDDWIVKAATADQGALPLLSFALDRLWRERDPVHGLLTFQAYERIGGMEGALGARAEELFSALMPEEQAALPAVLAALVSVGQGPSKAPTSRRAPLTIFPRGTGEYRLVEAFLNPDARLLVADGDGDGASVRIAHEALLEYWPRAKTMIAEAWEDLQRRARVEAATAIWAAARPEEKPDRLLPAGLQLFEAEAVLARYRHMLDTKTHEFVRISREAAEVAHLAALHRQKRINRIVAGAAFAVAALGLFALAFAMQASHNLALALLTNAEKSISEELPAHALALAHAANTSGPLASLRNRFGILGFSATDAIRANSIEALAEGSAADPSSTLVFPTAVLAADIAQHGSRFAVGDQNGRVLVGDTVEHDHQEILYGANSPIRSLKFSPDGTTLAAAADNGTITVWTLSRAGTSRILCAHRTVVNEISFDPSGRYLASVSNDQTAKIWDTSSWNSIKTLTPATAVDGAPSDWILSVAFSPDGRYLAFADQKGTVSIRNTVDWSDVASFQTGMSDLISLSFNASGTTIAIGSIEGPLEIWTTGATPQVVARITDHQDKLWRVRYTPKGRYLAVAYWNGTVRFRDADTQEYAGTLDRSDNWINDVAFSADGEQAITVDSDGVVRLWSLSGVRPLLYTFADNMRETLTGRYSPDGSLFLTGARDGKARLYTVDNQGHMAFRCAVQNADWVSQVAFTADGELAISAGTPADGSNNVIRVWGTQECHIVQDIPVGAQVVTALAASRRGTKFAWGTKSGTLWLTEGGSRFVPQPVPVPQTKEIRGLDLSPDGRFLAYGGVERTIGLWDFVNNRLALVLTGHKQPIDVLRFSPDGRYIASVGELEPTLFVWDVGHMAPAPAATIDIPGGAGKPYFDADTRILAATGDRLNFFGLWAVGSWSQMFELDHFTGVRGVFGFNPHTGDIALDGGNGQVRVLRARGLRPPVSGGAGAIVQGTSVSFDRLAPTVSFSERRPSADRCHE
jgi:WD40 repeat protein